MGEQAVESRQADGVDEREGAGGNGGRVFARRVTENERRRQREGEFVLLL